MNIAIFTDTYLPDINGVATSSHILHNELKKHGHHVIVITTTLPSGSDYIDDDHVLRLPGLDLKKLYGYRAANIYSFKGMKEIKDFQPDVIHIQTEFGIGRFGRIVGEILDVPVCYTYHTMWADYSHYISGSVKAVDTGAKKIIEKISKVYGDTCAELIVPSEKTKEALQSYGITNSINVVATGLELDRFDIKNKNQNMIDMIKREYHLEDKFVVIFLGRIAPEKSVDLLIDAMNDISKVTDDVRMLIVGGGPQLDELIQKVKDDQLDGIVYFTGPKESDLVPQYYHAANIFVSASITETQGLTFIEAMAAGIPVIARHDKNLEHVIIDDRNGYYIKDQVSLVDKLLELKDRDLSMLANNALQDAAQYSSENFYNKIIHVYQKALSKHRYCYKIEQIVKDKKGYLVTFSFDNHQVLINLTKDAIERYGLYVGQDIDREQLDALKDIEQSHIAYHKALKYLTYRDYTYEKMKKKLLTKGSFDEIQIDMAMDLLVQKNLIDDYEYARSYFKKCLRLGIGPNKAVFNLKNEGVSLYIIDECLAEYSSDLEFDKAVELITKLYNENTTKSPYALVQNIKNKLFNKGFTQDVVEKALDSFEFQFPKEHTRMLLEKEYQRVFNRYQSKYEGRMLKTKLITFLVQKGYEYEDVIEIINENWEDHDD